MDDSLSLTLAALADPTRRAIVARLARGEATVTELQAPFALSQPAISKHLKVLERAGLIEAGRAGQQRPRRLKPQALESTVAWFEQVRTHWGESFDRLEAFLATTDDQPGEAGT